MKSTRQLTLEWLEPRLVLSNSPFDQHAIVYDNGFTGNLISEFSRNVATIDDQGILRGIDEQRYGNEVDHAPLLTWDVQESLLPYANGRILATGLDHDGTTPLLILQNQSQSRLLIFRGETLELVGTIPYQNNALDLW